MCKQVCPRHSACNKLILETCEEAFHAGVVVGTPRCAHRGGYPVLREHRAVAHATVLHATVGMEDKPVVMAALHDGIGQRVLDKFGIDILAHGVAHRLLVNGSRNTAVFLGLCTSWHKCLTLGLNQKIRKRIFRHSAFGLSCGRIKQAFMILLFLWINKTFCDDGSRPII